MIDFATRVTCNQTGEELVIWSKQNNEPVTKAVKAAIKEGWRVFECAPARKGGGVRREFTIISYVETFPKCEYCMAGITRDARRSFAFPRSCRCKKPFEHKDVLVTKGSMTKTDIRSRELLWFVAPGVQPKLPDGCGQFSLSHRVSELEAEVERLNALLESEAR